MSRRLSIVSVWDLSVFSFMEKFIITIIYVLNFLLVFKLYKFGLQILYLISSHVIFLYSVDIRGYLVVACCKRWILTLIHFWDTFSDLQIVQNKPLYHTIFSTWAIHWKCKSNHYLLLLAIFPDLEMTQFWYVNYIWQVYKSKFLILI